MAEAIRGPRAIVGIRRRAVAVSVPRWERDYRRYFAGFERRFMAWYGRKAGESWGVKAEPGTVAFLKGFDWDNEKAGVKSLLDMQYAAMTEMVWTDVVGAQVGKTLAFDLNARGVERVLGKVGTRVTQITEASQRLIAGRVASGIAGGANTDKIERSVRELLRGWGETGGRAHIIALTETGFAYNYAATEGYRESGLVEEVQVYDGPDCGWTEHDDPDEADGSTRTLEEAEAYPLAHPHCQRAFGPVVSREAPAEEPTPPEPAAAEPAPTEAEATQRAADEINAAGLRSDWSAVEPVHNDLAGTFDDFTRSLSFDQRDALADYRGSGYQDINRYWYKRVDLSTSRARWAADRSRHIDSVFRQSPGLPSDTVSFRGIAGEALPKGRLEGRVITGKGYSSTSLDASRAARFTENKPGATVLRILSPKGTKAYYMDPGASPWENELMLPEGTKFRVLKDRTREVDVYGTQQTRRVLDVVVEAPKGKAGEVPGRKAGKLDPRKPPRTDLEYWGFEEGSVTVR